MKFPSLPLSWFMNKARLEADHEIAAGCADRIFEDQARMDQKTTHHPGCRRGIYDCLSTVCGCDEATPHEDFVTERIKILKKRYANQMTSLSDWKLTDVEHGQNTEDRARMIFDAMMNEKHRGPISNDLASILLFAVGEEAAKRIRTTRDPVGFSFSWNGEH